MTKHEAKIPFRLLWVFLRRGNRWTLILIIFLMSVAFINMIFVPTLFDGVIKAADDQVVDMSTGHILMLPESGQNQIADAEKAVEQLRSIPGVVGVSSGLALPTTLEYNNIRGNWQTIAIDPDNERMVTKIFEHMIEGSYLREHDLFSIIIGRQIAGGEDVENNAFSFKDAEVGDTVKVSFDGFSEDFKIGGIFYSKFIDTDQKAFITRDVLDKVVPALAGEANRIIVRLDEDVSVESIVNKISAADIDGIAYSWEDAVGLMKSVTKSFVSINILMTLVASLIAAVTIFIVIYIDVSSKRKQIGILRAIGVKPSLIVWSYIFQAIVYALSGILFGTALYFAALVPYFSAFPFVLPIGDARLAFDAVGYVIRLETFIFVSIGAGLIPVLFITRIKLLNAIWGR